MQAANGTVRDNLAGAWAVMRGRPDGLARLDLSIDGFWRSFYAVVLLAPFVALALASESVAGGPAEATPRTLTVGLALGRGIAVLIDWFAFPLIFAALARPLGLGARYVPYIIARNWSAPIVAAIASVAHAAPLLGVATPEVTAILLLAALGVALRFAYVIARTTLMAPVTMVLPIVILDALVSITIGVGFERFAYSSG